MRPHNGGVDDQVFEVGIFSQRIENTLPHAFLGPSPKALEYAVPVAKLTGQIAPWRPCTNQPNHGVHEQAVVLAVPSSISFFPRNKRFDTPPLGVRQFAPNQDRPLSCDLESHWRVEGNPLRKCQQDLALRRRMWRDVVPEKIKRQQ